jgi:uncharacterized hydrophobic protein (TIGR00271 family)
MKDNLEKGSLSEAWAVICGKISDGLDVPQDLHPAVYRGILAESDWKTPYYWICLLSSCGIATLGLAQNSPAVIIGAMLLSPLMSPIVGLGLALAVGDLFLGLRSLVNCLISVVSVVGLAALIALALPFKEVTAEILARTRPNPLDLFIAIFCGLVASISVAKSYRAGAGMALPGAAIAVALVPPLCVAGWGLGAGVQGTIFRGAMVLFLTNLTAIVFLSLLVFLALGIGNPAEAPAIRGVLDQVEQGRLARWAHSHPWAARFRRVGSLRGRILLVAVAVGALYIPLNSGLRQVKRELLVNREVRKSIPEYLGKTTILSRRVTPTADGALVHLTLVSERQSPVPAISEMESYLKGKLGPNVVVDFAEVARGTYPQTPAYAEPATPQQSLHQVVSMVRSGALSELAGFWPEVSGYALVDVSLVVPSGAAPPGLRVRYIADEEIPSAALEGFRLAAQRTLGLGQLVLEGQRTARTWAELDLDRTWQPRSLQAWARRVRSQEGPLPAGMRWIATLRYPKGTSPEMVKRYEASALKALAALSAESLGASMNLPQAPIAVPIPGSSKCTLVLELGPSGAPPSR